MSQQIGWGLPTYRAQVFAALCLEFRLGRLVSEFILVCWSQLVGAAKAERHCDIRRIELTPRFNWEVDPGCGALAQP